MNCFKQSVISLIYKSKEKYLAEQGKCMTNNIRKIIERCIKNRIVKFLKNSKCISKYQYGFQNRLSADYVIY